MRYKLMISGWKNFPSICDGETNDFAVAQDWANSNPHRFYVDTQK